MVVTKQLASLYRAYRYLDDNQDFVLLTGRLSKSDIRSFVSKGLTSNLLPQMFVTTQR